MSSTDRVRCRPIAEADLSAVASLLTRGFPARSLAWWTRGLDRLARRDPSPRVPRFGYLLDAGGRIVGVLLLIFSRSDRGGLRCNLSSWYVEPAFRSHAAMLSLVPLRHREATFLNVSAAPNTWATIEAQGFRRFTAGQVVACPALARGGERGLSVEPYRPGLALPEADLLADHAAWGCLTLVGHAPDGLHPFVFLPARARQGRLPLPGVQLVHCRSLASVARFAAPLGRALLRRGTPLLLADADGPVPGLPGWLWRDRARKYVKGPNTPRLGDLAYTEFTIFGP